MGILYINKNAKELNEMEEMYGKIADEFLEWAQTNLTEMQKNKLSKTDKQLMRICFMQGAQYVASKQVKP